MRIPKNPLVYEIHTAAFLRRLSSQYKREIHLDTVPAAEWDKLAALNVRIVWLMGVWERSPAGTRLSMADKSFLRSLQNDVPGLHTRDVIGSAYCIRNYKVDELFGGEAGLAIARKELAKRDIKLMLDFVPNHTAPDHPWILEHPEYFIAGTVTDFKAEPSSFVQIDQHVFARGRDPHLAAWPDVVQLNAFSSGYRQAAIETLRTIANQADAVRCDMAMLILNDIFSETWSERAGKKPSQEFWTEVITNVHETHPDFVFLAEAYWDTEAQLISQGFGYCYDKTLYDLLLEGSAAEIHDYLERTNEAQKNLCHFIENHDEPRAAALLPLDKATSAAVIMLTLPGMPLLHDGQMEGFKTKIPVHVSQGPAETTDVELQTSYKKLLRALRDWQIAKLQWYLWQTDNKNILAWEWRNTRTRHIIIVNYSEHRTQADLQVDTATSFTDALSDQAIITNDQGRFSLELKPWEAALLTNATLE